MMPRPLCFRRLCRLLLCAAFSLLLQPGTTLHAESPSGAYIDLSDRLNRKIAEFDWAGGNVGAMVVDFRHGITAFAHNADAGMRPGPAGKLITSAAALETLGPDFKFTTELFIRGELSRGRLLGDLMIRGDGDPSLRQGGGSDGKALERLLSDWSRLVRKEGVSRIEGSIWVDASAFDAVPYAAGWPVEQRVHPFIPEVSALNMNANCLEVLWKSGKKQNRIAEFELYPPVEDYIYLSNNVRLVPAESGERRYFRRPGFTTIAVEGTLPLRTTAHDRVTVPDPALFFGHVLKTRLAKDGVELVGGVADWTGADPVIQESRGLRRLGRVESPPLRDLLPPMLKDERTLDAEVIFKTLGRRSVPGPGSFENGSSAITTILKGWGIPTSGVVLVDGSGLSSFNRISPRRMMGVLEAVHRSPWQQFFMPAVPRISLDHVLQDRGAGEAGRGLNPELVVQGMSGEFEAGYAAAGWAETGGRSRLHFVIMVEGTRVPPALIRTQVDVLMREIAQTAIP